MDISLGAVRITDPFWRNTQRLISETVLPYQWEALNDRVSDAEPSHCMRNFQIAAGMTEGCHEGMVFQDSDVYKWLEAVAYCLAIHGNPALEASADEAIAIITSAQQPDGYLNTYYTLHEPDQRFCNLTEGHELYCAGHLFEAAVAYADATGKQTLLAVATRLADCLARHFLREDDRHMGYPGHPEVELALLRLYGATQREDFLRLCLYFLNARGQGESWREKEAAQGGFHRHWNDALFDMPDDYAQAHAPVRAQRKATGHAVRAMYLYSAMADAARLCGDTEMAEACLALYENTVTRQMYVTGGIGSSAIGERFTADYDLPNESAYAETCAGVGLMMFSSRMWALTGRADCFDTWERALYNTVLAGMGRDGRHFFYVNPLSVNPYTLRKNPGLAHVLATRPKWFGCACCPPNLARSVLSIGRSLYALDRNTLYLLSHIDSDLTLDGLRASLTHVGPLCRLMMEGPALTLKLRIPEGFDLVPERGTLEGGYLIIPHTGGKATYSYRLIPRARVLRAHPRIAQDAGKLCVTEGQIVYCLEEADNGSGLCMLALPADAAFTRVEMDWLPDGMHALRAEGFRRSDDDWLHAYEERVPVFAPQSLTFVPYSQWNNRGEGEMCVWVQEAR